MLDVRAPGTPFSGVAAVRHTAFSPAKDLSIRFVRVRGSGKVSLDDLSLILTRPQAADS